MTLEEKIENEREKNDWLALEIARLKGRPYELTQSGGLAGLARRIELQFQAAGELAELKRQKQESDERLAALKREMQQTPQGPAAADKLANLSQYPTMNIGEVRRAFGGVSRSTIYRWTEEGKLQRAHLGKKRGRRGRVLFLTASVKKMLEDSPE